MSPEELSIMDLAAFLRMPVYKLINEMPYEEFLLWGEYFEERPIGVRDDYRAAVIVSAFQPKADVTRMFPSLVGKKPKAAGIKDSLFYNLMKKAKYGVILED